MRSPRAVVCLIALASAVLIAGAAWAQIPTGSISGRVSSEQGVLPGAQVTVTSPSLQGERSATTNANGDYVIPLLPPGTYSVRFALDGFVDANRSVSVSTGQTTHVEAELHVAEVSEEIVVTGTLEKISTEPQSSVTYPKTFVEELAIERNIRQATLLAPAVAETGPRSGRVPNLIVSGNMSYENLFLVNGVVVNENLRGQPLDLFIEDALEETTVSTSGISAAYGRFAGGVINAITRSGGNEFSGSFRTNFTNQKWEGKTPLTPEQTDKVNKIYEGTLGGYLWKDRVWFFAAARDRETAETSFTLAPATTPYARDINQRRYEGKLTFSLNASHRVVATAFKIDESETGNNFNNVALDLDSLVERETPQELKALNYTGIFSNNFFVEAQYSERKFEFIDSGSRFTDLILGTLIVGTGGERWNSPTFCGVCRTEERSNENLLAKATYFLSAGSLGSHELLAGYDTFDDIRVADNHQSGSDFRVTGVTPVVQGSGRDAVVFGRYVVGATAGTNPIIQWNPILTSSRGNSFKTNSYFVNDSWRLNDRLSFNVGLRYDENDGKDQSGAKVIQDSRVSPRLAATWDPKGNGDLQVSAAWGRYVAAIANSQADAASAAGNPAAFTWNYRGPSINAAGTPTISNHQALDIILQAKNLGLKKSGNVILIAPKDELSAKEKLDLESKKQIAELEPLRPQGFQLNYTKAEEVAKSLTGQLSGSGGGTGGTTTNARLLTPRGSVSYDVRTNQLFVIDTPSKLEEVQAMIARIDTPVRQVQIEARIVEAADTFGRSLGVRLGFADYRGIQGGIPGWGSSTGGRAAIGGNLNAVGATTLQPGAAATFADTTFVNLPANVSNQAFAGSSATTFALSLFSVGANRFLNLELSALEADGKGKVVSSPRIITADQVKAAIRQGSRIPYQKSTSSGATAVEFIDAVLKLEVTPQITPEGNVIMTVEINKDSVGAVFGGVPSINTKSVQTQVLVENGGTVVIGGIFEQNELEQVQKVPFLGDVPYLGNLFKTRTKTADKTELLIFLTPKVVTDKTAVR